MRAKSRIKRVNIYLSVVVWGKTFRDLFCDWILPSQLSPNNILQLQDGFARVVNRSEYDVFMGKPTEGIGSIYQLAYTINDDTGFVDVTDFNTSREENTSLRSEFDLRKGSNKPFPSVGSGGRRLGRMRMFI